MQHITGMPSISQDMNGKLTHVEVGGVAVWFSYSTPVAIRRDGHDLIVRENVWGTTTGKHLNAIDGGHSRTAEGRAIVAARVSGERFAAIARNIFAAVSA